MAREKYILELTRGQLDAVKNALSFCDGGDSSEAKALEEIEKQENNQPDREVQGITADDITEYWNGLNIDPLTNEQVGRILDILEDNYDNSLSNYDNIDNAIEEFKEE